MANFFEANLTNVKKTNPGDKAKVPLGLTYIITTLIINSIACPLIVVLNVLVIKAVKTRRQLRTNCNILLACLAVTDAVTGLIVQPLYILRRLLQFINDGESEKWVATAHRTFHIAVLTASLLHLMLVTFERLVAIKFTMHYSSVITGKTLKITVGVFWVFSLIQGVISRLKYELIKHLVGTPLLVSCILFVTSTYVVLYREALRHRKKIKTHQLPQEEVERVTRENKALKTTVFVIGAIVVCLLPAVVSSFLHIFGVVQGKAYASLTSWIRTFTMLNSLVNPLIYCWRQKEMRKSIFCSSYRVVDPANQ
ncbi:lysophosphatidic acid receptor 3-like [Stylophora pistillata]|uniref:lysophosphatidic acid receptor 3-like n=1 Tax=Stylophora pistillata TaxID=50429 RepID=UPI000C03CDF8|nr:lysophosphatidic acid receptor 3-like [Stylophora pistillata]